MVTKHHLFCDYESKWLAGVDRYINMKILTFFISGEGLQASSIFDFIYV